MILLHTIQTEGSFQELYEQAVTGDVIQLGDQLETFDPCMDWTVGPTGIYLENRDSMELLTYEGEVQKLPIDTSATWYRHKDSSYVSESGLTFHVYEAGMGLRIFTVGPEGEAKEVSLSEGVMPWQQYAARNTSYCYQSVGLDTYGYQIDGKCYYVDLSQGSISWSTLGPNGIYYRQGNAFYWYDPMEQTGVLLGSANGFYWGEVGHLGIVFEYLHDNEDCLSDARVRFALLVVK